MTKFEKLINKKVDREDYNKFVNPIHQKMIDENGNKKPTFKECISVIKRLYRLEMKTTISKQCKFIQTSGNRNTWSRDRWNWKINIDTTWEDIIHNTCHWIEHCKYGSNAKIHNLNSFRIEKRFVEYAYKHKWHLGTLIKATKPKVEVSKDVLMIERLTNNILKKESKLKTTIKRTETLLKKNRKKLKYYQKKVANGVVPKKPSGSYAYKEMATKLNEQYPEIVLFDATRYGEVSNFPIEIELWFRTKDGISKISPRMGRIDFITLLSVQQKKIWLEHIADKRGNCCCNTRKQVYDKMTQIIAKGLVKPIN